MAGVLAVDVQPQCAVLLRAGLRASGLPNISIHRAMLVEASAAKMTTLVPDDECIGSDVFGSDICTCRPYLIFALEQCIQCAQRGGVGIVIYYRKEGRSLGEVIKFRVYNARENQQSGDTADNYFHHTESIAGIRDARFQQMMPDALKWLGIKRIDWLCSMSNEKYEAIVGYSNSLFSLSFYEPTADTEVSPFAIVV